MASGTNVSAGIVAMVTNMDPDDSQFTNITQLENYEGSVSGPPFAGHFVHDVAVAHKSRGRNRSKGDALSLNQYFVFSSANVAAPTGQAAKFFDMGQFQLAVNGCQAATPAGELWVEHEWTLIRRKQETPIGQQVLFAHVVESTAATASAAAPLGTGGGAVRSGATIPVVTTNTTFTLPIAGTFFLGCNFGGSATVAPTFTPGANITSAPAILNDSASAALSVVTGGTALALQLFTVSANGTAAANTVTISGLTNFAAGKSDIVITQVSGAILLALKSGKFCQDDSALQAIMDRLARLEKERALPRAITEMCVSEPDTPCEEIKESELESSVHISKSTAEQLLRGLGLKK